MNYAFKMMAVLLALGVLVLGSAGFAIAENILNCSNCGDDNVSSLIQTSKTKLKTFIFKTPKIYEAKYSCKVKGSGINDTSFDFIDSNLEFLIKHSTFKAKINKKTKLVTIIASSNKSTLLNEIKYQKTMKDELYKNFPYKNGNWINVNEQTRIEEGLDHKG